MFDWLKRIIGKKPAETPVAVVATPAPQEADPLAEFVEGLRDDYESRIETLRGLEQESASDSLRAKWRARREEVEDLLKELP